MCIRDSLPLAKTVSEHFMGTKNLQSEFFMCENIGPKTPIPHLAGYCFWFFYYYYYYYCVDTIFYVRTSRYTYLCFDY